MGHDLAWDVITGGRMAAASVAGLRGDPDPMKGLFREIMDPDRVRALRQAVRFLSGTKLAWNDLYLATTAAGARYRGVLVRRMAPDFLMRVRSERGDWLVVGKEEDLPPEAVPSQDIEICPRKW
jgi:cell filamentation protein